MIKHCVGNLVFRPACGSANFTSGIKKRQCVRVGPESVLTDIVEREEVRALGAGLPGRVREGARMLIPRLGSEAANHKRTLTGLPALDEAAENILGLHQMKGEARLSRFLLDLAARWLRREIGNGSGHDQHICATFTLPYRGRKFFRRFHPHDVYARGRVDV